VKENNVDSIRLVQVFLSQTQTPGPGIYEVSSDLDGGLYCTCPGYRARSLCKHTKFVDARIKSNDGNYPIEISSKATKAEAKKAQRSNEDFREFIIRYGKIEVY
jgi:hypothetical protein